MQREEDVGFNQGPFCLKPQSLHHFSNPLCILKWNTQGPPKVVAYILMVKKTVQAASKSINKPVLATSVYIKALSIFP